ncbi:MAG: peptidylprolyl isomerase [Bryobacteraceae bacterium]|jgi:parvulin-like peptidyl-prolyl isomerase
MKMTLMFPLFAAGLLAQVVTAPQNPPASPLTGRPEASRVQPGTAVVPPSPDKVVAKLNGKPLTVADVDKLLSDLPMQLQGAITREPERFLQQLMVFEELERQAEQEGLDKKDPYRQELAYRRLMTLAQAEIDKARNSVRISPDQEHQYYETNKATMYRVVKTKVIFVGFSAATPAPAPGAPQPAASPAANGITRTEADAKAKIDDLRKQVLAGGDFGKLAKENSDDKISAAKDGDYGDIIRTSPYPEPIKKAIFALKPGEVSEPIRQPSGFYLIKAADSSFQPLDQVRLEIHNLLVGQEFQKHMDAISAQFNVTVEDRTYFTTRPAK